MTPDLASIEKLAREAAGRIIVETDRRLEDYPITPEWKDADDVARAYVALLESHRALSERARTMLDQIDALIADSHGVYGLHLNGDPSPWSELTDDGRFGEWLSGIEPLRVALRAEAATLRQSVTK